MMGPFQFNGRTAFVTGAGSGIGAAAALAFARAGAQLALADVNEAGIETTAAADCPRYEARDFVGPGYIDPASDDLHP